MKVSLGPKVGTSLLPLLPRSLVQQLPLAEHELTVLICCLWRSLWGRHRVLLKHSRNGKISCVKLRVCMFIHRRLIL